MNYNVYSKVPKARTKVDSGFMASSDIAGGFPEWIQVQIREGFENKAIQVDWELTHRRFGKGVEAIFI